MSRGSCLFLISILLLWNIIVFLLYAVDKHKARRQRWRISERTLLMSAFLVGGIGAWCSMRLVHHKIMNRKFRILVPFALVLTVLVYALLFYLYFFPIPR